jgi:hypothetical protein
VTTGSLDFLAPLVSLGVLGAVVVLVGLGIRLSKRRLVSAEGILLAPVGVVGFARVRWDDATEVSRDAAALYVGRRKPIGSPVQLRHQAKNPHLVEIVNANTDGVYVLWLGGIVAALGLVAAAAVFFTT